MRTITEHQPAPHPAALRYAAEYRDGRLGRREFLTRATALGMGAGAACGLIGVSARGALAQDHGAGTHGGTLRIQMDLKAMKEPRRFDWSELANFCRGWLEYLVEYNRDGTLRGMLLEDWEASDDASTYTLHLRRGVRWNNGDPFIAEDVAHNFALWCDESVAGNSMATRMTPLIDPATGRLRAGAVEILDDHTLQLHLATPSVAIIADISDYPAAVVHRSFNGGDPVENPLGTGPFLPEHYDTGLRGALVRNAGHDWWGSDAGAYLDRIEFVDLGTDPSSWLAAAEGGEIDMLYQTTGDFIDLFDAIGMSRSETVTAATLAVRFNQDSPPFDARDVRRAIQMAVDNGVVLELGYDDRGAPGENHHVAPLHPEYADIGPPRHDPEAAREMLASAGHGDTVFELISLDDSWQSASCDAVAAQMRDAGMRVERAILPGATFWNDWMAFPFSATEWNMRPLGVQVLALAYRTDGAWNETAFSNAEFDALLAEANSLADVDARRAVMARLQEILRDEGVLIQPYWRAVFRHFRPHVRNAGIHPTFEMHLYKYWLES